MKRADRIRGAADRVVKAAARDFWRAIYRTPAVERRAQAAMAARIQAAAR